MDWCTFKGVVDVEDVGYQSRTRVSFDSPKAAENLYKRSLRNTLYGSIRVFEYQSFVDYHIKQTYIIMGSVGQSFSQELPVRGKTDASVFGSSMKKEFMFDQEWRNLNHGM